MGNISAGKEEKLDTFYIWLTFNLAFFHFLEEHFSEENLYNGKPLRHFGMWQFLLPAFIFPFNPDILKQVVMEIWHIMNDRFSISNVSNNSYGNVSAFQWFSSLLINQNETQQRLKARNSHYCSVQTTASSVEWLSYLTTKYGGSEFGSFHLFLANFSRQIKYGLFSSGLIKKFKFKFK